MFVQQLLNGLTNGSIYALMAVGVTMVYKALGMLNFAHGDILMVGTFNCDRTQYRCISSSWICTGALGNQKGRV